MRKIFAALTTEAPVSPGRALMFETCLQHYDNACRYRAIVEQEGPLLRKTRRSKMSHLHPLLIVAQREQDSFERLALKLSLHWDGFIDSGMGGYPDENEGATAD